MVVKLNAHGCLIYGGESEMPMDVQSMVVKTDQGPWMIIHGGEIEMPIDV